MISSRALLLSMLLSGCGLQTIDETPCPGSGTQLSYDNFGKGFLDGYCQRCHGATGPDRNGAPSAYDFKTAGDVRGWRERIFARAAGNNTTMPPGPDDPPEDARQKLAEWLACGAP